MGSIATEEPAIPVGATPAGPVGATPESPTTDGGAGRATDEPEGPAADGPAADVPAGDGSTNPAGGGTARTASGHAAPAGGPAIPEEVAMGPASGDVFRAFMRTMRLHGQLMIRMLAEQGSHPGQAICLRILADDDGLGQSDLADRLHLSRPTVTSMLQRLERDGSIERRVDEEDQRIMRVHLTDEGRRRERRLRASLAEYAGRILDPLPEPDRRELARLLGVMADNLQEALSERADGLREEDMEAAYRVAHGAAAGMPGGKRSRGSSGRAASPALAEGGWKGTARS